jgi:uroporphyrinogen-III synthase
MRVVVIRPKHSATKTADRLKALGHEPVLLPLTEAAHDHTAAAEGLAKPHSALIITSAEAVRVIAGILEKSPDTVGKTVFAVGEATAEAARRAGFSDIRTGPGTGAGLAQLIAETAPRLPQPLLYLAGDPRSPELEETLRQSGIAVTTALMYRMAPVPYGIEDISHALLSPQADAILLYSRRNAGIFFDHVQALDAELASLKILCLSANVADAVPERFRNNIRIARSPDEEGLFAFL